MPQGPEGPPPAMPDLPPLPEAQEAGEGLGSRLGPLMTIPDEESGPEFVKSPRTRSRHKFGVPLGWERYWEASRDVRVEERDATFHIYTAGTGGPLLLCLHGGGYTGLTWSLLAPRVKDTCRIVAMDLRGHGLTKTNDDEDLSAETLCADVIALWKALCKEESHFSTVLLGHSLGGAMAIRTGATGKITGLQGLIVIDVVEGTALASLPHMMSVLHKRPKEFDSLREAVDWALCSHMSRSEEAASVSVPSMLQQGPEGGSWHWRTPLWESEAHWRGWFTGLSELFLAVKAPKLLALVGTDRLDRELTIGQMQGRFQMAVLPSSGHAVQEDNSEKVAEIVQKFVERFRIGRQLPASVWVPGRGGPG
ncbi:unnamed protein product [Ostreobium quekettii]|uniref:Protein phosphatase methylesterase 1 n=1 Tax=Ostreobium quekettii TaxID=121088 RepID=A0A8S1ISD9_9CHLO|nr:unnamed protein product [Ostreobium quekettii]|eukprot:evm.model.scf_48.22 EVM.evm.TU.scf_48.22   scf_48:181461-184242(-)